MPKFKPQQKRIIWLHEQLSRKPGQRKDLPNCKTLARDFELDFDKSVSSRTIRRDLDYLREIGAPIDYDPGTQGYFYFEEDYSLPAFEMSESELFFLCIAERAAEQYRGTPMFKKVQSVVEKIRAAIPTGKVSIDPIMLSGRVSFMDAPSRWIDLDIWEEVSKALSKGRTIEIKYLKPGHPKPVARNVQPYHLASYRGDWYLIGFCRLRKEIRTFAVSRIKAVKRTGHHFRIPSDFDAGKYLSNRFGIMRSEKTYNIRIKFDPTAAPYATARKWLNNQEVKENRDGSVVLTGTASHLGEITSWILSWGPRAKVLAPKQLKEEITATLRETAKVYR